MGDRGISSSSTSNSNNKSEDDDAKKTLFSSVLGDSPLDLFPTATTTTSTSNAAAKPKFQPKLKPRGGAAATKGRPQKFQPQPKKENENGAQKMEEQDQNQNDAMDMDIDVKPTQTQALQPQSAAAAPSLDRDVKPSTSPQQKQQPHKDMDINLKPPQQQQQQSHVKDENDLEEKPNENDLEEKPNIDVGFESPQDKVVREIDVYLAPCVDPDTKIYLMQYPLRPHWRSYGLEDRCQEVRVKPKQSRVEIDLTMDTNEQSYDQSIDEHLKITKQTLTSLTTPLSTSYAIGILRKNKLYLTPVQAAVQLRPSMSYLDTGNENMKRNRKTGDPENVAKEEESAMSKPKLEQIQVKRETERQEQIRLQSHAHFKKMDEAEPWIKLEPHGPESPVTMELLRKIVSVEDSQIPFDMNPHDYINTFVPGRVSSGYNDNINASGNEGFSRCFLDSLPLEKRFEILLSKGRDQVLEFDYLKRFAPKGTPEEDVIKFLEQYALLVQGCWVPASTCLYSGNANHAARIARDYILLLFSKNRIIRNKQLENIQIPKETLREILQSLACQRPQEESWEFREATDKSFIKNHPNVFKEHNERWLENEEAIRQAAFSIKFEESDLKNVSASPVEASKAPEKISVNIPSQVSKVGTVAESNRAFGGIMSDETRAALPGVLREILAGRVLNFQMICQELRNLAKSKANSGNRRAALTAAAAAKGANAPEELKSVISEVASNINGIYFLKSIGNETVDRYREVVIKLLTVKHDSEPLKKQVINQACETSVGSQMSSAIYNKVMKELCTSKNGGWVLKKGDGRPE